MQERLVAASLRALLPLVQKGLLKSRSLFLARATDGQLGPAVLELPAVLLEIPIVRGAIALGPELHFASAEGDPRFQSDDLPNAGLSRHFQANTSFLVTLYAILLNVGP